MNKLSKRLQAIYNLVLPCNTLLEIGCDHCWLSIFLLKAGKVKNIIASDINIEPLESCKLNAKNNGIDNIYITLSDGFLNIDKVFDAVVIAGIGAKLICNILEQKNDFENIQLVLQPQKNEHIIRLYLKNNNLKILDEVIICENNIIYTIISVEKSGKKIIDDIDIYIGPILKNDKSSIHINKITKRINHLERFVDNIKENKKKGEISREINVLKKFIK